MDGVAVLSCSTLAVEADGHEILTVEGLKQDDPVIEAFATQCEPGFGTALQCGYCTPGFVMATKALLVKNPNPVGQWNHAAVISKGNHVEHWLNGRKVLEYERKTPEFRNLIQESKYKSWPGFGEWKEGHILLQDHGNTVSVKNIKIRKIEKGG